MAFNKSPTPSSARAVPFDPRRGVFHLLWSKCRLPDPGAGVYAYASEALAAFTPVGVGIGPRRQFFSMNTPLVALEAVAPKGMPTISGAIVFQPLYDPHAAGSGYSRGVSPFPAQSPVNAVL